MRKLLKCNAKVDKGKADLQLFAQDTTGTRYPASIRTFKSAAEGRAGFNAFSVQGAWLGLHGDNPSGHFTKVCSTEITP